MRVARVRYVCVCVCGGVAAGEKAVQVWEWVIRLTGRHVGMHGKVSQMTW